MIVVFGSINVDLVANVAAIPRPGETVLSPGYRLLFGGKGANQAVAAARASGGTGIEVRMVGRVGEDEFGRAANRNLREQGVSIDLVSSGPEPTGCAFIAVDKAGENAITVASGANLALTAAAAPPAFSASDILVLQMETPFAEALAVARRARQANARVVWNLAPAPPGFARDKLCDLLEAATIVVVNEHEAVAAAGILGVASRDSETAAKKVASAGRADVVLTAGARGARAFMADGGRHSAPAPPARVVDTTGAGDTFVGVLAVGLAEGATLAAAIGRACAAASLSCESVGAQPGMPTRGEIDRLVPGSA